MTDKDKIKFAIRYLKKGLKSKRTPPLYEELMNELGFEKKVNNHSGVAVDFFKENYPEYVTEKGECLSPYWDLFSAGVICATFELNNKIAELKDKLNNLASVAKVRLANWQKYSKELKEAKEIIKRLIKETYGEGWNYSLQVKVEAEKFLKESE